MPIRGAPGTGINTIRNPLSPLAPDSSGRVRLSQQYLETINDGDANKVRLSQQYLEAINDGANNKIRLSQQYVEIVHTFGTAPVVPRKTPPGQEKKVDKYVALVRHRRVRRETRSHETTALAFLPAQYLSPGGSIRLLDAIDWRTSTRRIFNSPSGHTVRNS